MSEEMREYKSLNLGPGSKNMSVHRFLGPMREGKRISRCVQFTIGDHYCALTEENVFDLIHALIDRL